MYIPEPRVRLVDQKPEPPAEVDDDALSEILLIPRYDKAIQLLHKHYAGSNFFTGESLQQLAHDAQILDAHLGTNSRRAVDM